MAIIAHQTLLIKPPVNRCRVFIFAMGPFYNVVSLIFDRQTYTSILAVIIAPVWGSDHLNRVDLSRGGGGVNPVLSTSRCLGTTGTFPDMEADFQWDITGTVNVPL